MLPNMSTFDLLAANFGVENCTAIWGDTNSDNRIYLRLWDRRTREIYYCPDQLGDGCTWFLSDLDGDITCLQLSHLQEAQQVLAQQIGKSVLPSLNPNPCPASSVTPTTKSQSHHSIPSPEAATCLTLPSVLPPPIQTKMSAACEIQMARPIDFEDGKDWHKFH